MALSYLSFQLHREQKPRAQTSAEPQSQAELSQPQIQPKALKEPLWGWSQQFPGAGDNQKFVLYLQHSCGFKTSSNLAVHRYNATSTPAVSCPEVQGWGFSCRDVDFQ